MSLRGRVSRSLADFGPDPWLESSEHKIPNSTKSDIGNELQGPEKEKIVRNREQMNSHPSVINGHLKNGKETTLQWNWRNGK
jgi:hypothetical protein